MMDFDDRYRGGSWGAKHKKLEALGAAWAQRFYLYGWSDPTRVGNLVHDRAAAIEWKRLTGRDMP